MGHTLVHGKIRDQFSLSIISAYRDRDERERERDTVTAHVCVHRLYIYIYILLYIYIYIIIYTTAALFRGDCCSLYTVEGSGLGRVRPRV